MTIQVILTRDDLRALLDGTKDKMGYAISEDLMRFELGSIRSGMSGERWEWNYDKLETLDENELWGLYCKISVARKSYTKTT